MTFVYVIIIIFVSSQFSVNAHKIRIMLASASDWVISGWLSYAAKIKCVCKHIYLLAEPRAASPHDGKPFYLA